MIYYVQIILLILIKRKYNLKYLRHKIYSNKYNNDIPNKNEVEKIEKFKMDNNDESDISKPDNIIIKYILFSNKVIKI